MAPDRFPRSDIRRHRSALASGPEYDEQFARLAAAGHDVHGEASFVMGLGARTALDAGCGTGRVAIELWQRGLEVVGVDHDDEMLDVARSKAPELRWVCADLVSFDLREPFDVVACVGNVMSFLEEGNEQRAVARMAAHLVPGGCLVSGFQVLRRRFDAFDYDACCEAAGLDLEVRYASWDRRPWSPDSGYVVCVHRSPVAPADQGLAGSQ